MNQEHLLIAAIAIITVVFSCVIIFIQNKLDDTIIHIAPVMERRTQDEAMIGTLRRTVATTRKQLEDEKKFSEKLISDHTKKSAEAYRHALELQENNVMLLLERNNLQLELDSAAAQLTIKNIFNSDDVSAIVLERTKQLGDECKQLEETIQALNKENALLKTEIKQAADTLDKAKKLLQRGARGQDTLAALVLIEEYQKNK